MNCIDSWNQISVDINIIDRNTGRIWDHGLYGINPFDPPVTTLITGPEQSSLIDSACSQCFIILVNIIHILVGLGYRMVQLTFLHFRLRFEFFLQGYHVS